MSPESHILVCLGDVVEVVRRSETSPDRTLLDGVAKLEEAATVVEKDLRSALIGYSDDQATNDWLTRELRCRAAGLRMLKRQLYLPLDGDVEDLATRCGELVVVALDRRWAELPEADPTSVVAARRKLQEVVRSLLVAAVPLALIAGADRFSDSFDGVAMTWAWVAAVGWSVVVLLLLIDPQLEEKLDIANRVLPWIPRGPNAGHDGEGRTSG